MRKRKINGGIVGKCVLVLVSVVMLASCRLVITTNSKGHIESDSGLMNCGKAATCEFEIKESVTETFTAVPAQGFRFISWRGICKKHPTNVCETTVAPLPEELQEHDGDIGLKAVFESNTSTRRWFQDEDGDHFGNSTVSEMSAERPKGFVVHKGDCDDTDPEIRPWIKEREDGRDTNCNGKVDEGFVDIEFFLDQDGDGFGNSEFVRSARQRPAGYVRNDLDCDDGNAERNPESEEVMDGLDNDCDGLTDETGDRYYRDVDGDGYGRPAAYVETLEPLEGYVDNASDCDDNNSQLNPSAKEVFDSVDNNCNGAIDEGFTAHNYYRDIDGDGFGDKFDSVRTLAQPKGYVVKSGDNCVDTSNPSQLDVDNDGIGDACDPVDDRPALEPELNVCTMTAEDHAMLDAVNIARAQTRMCGAQAFSAVPALTWNCNLEAAALGHSKDMANNNYFSHTGKNGSSSGDRISQAGYSWSTYGENIAAGSGYSAANAVVQGWLDSPGHCSNIMEGNFTHLGAAKYSNASSTYGVYWTQVLGRSQ